MKLHNDKEVFTQAILATAEYFKIQEVFVEKDYWVTYVLKNLSQSKHKGTVVFKGGTSVFRRAGNYFHGIIHSVRAFCYLT